MQHESSRDVRRGATECGAWQDWDLDSDGDSALVTCGIPGSECFRGDGCGEFVGRHPARGVVPLNPGVELCQGANGGEIAGEGFWSSLY